MDDEGERSGCPSQRPPPIEPDDLSFLESLEMSLSSETDDLEDRHLAAAIDAQVSLCPDERKSDRPDAIFDDYVNPDAVSNCFSPFVPANAAQIASFFGYLRSRSAASESFIRPTLLDLGSGDGRVCVAAARLGLVRLAVGLDVSPPCVSAARLLAFREGVFGVGPPPDDAAEAAEEATTNGRRRGRCVFYEVDLTTAPALLLDNPHLLAETLREADMVFLYAHPTLLSKIVPLLARLTESRGNTEEKNGRSDPSAAASRGTRPIEVVTLVHHLPDGCLAPGTNAFDVPGTDLRVYDHIVARNDVSGDFNVAGTVPPSLPPRPPEPVDSDVFDREFARDSIRHALPRCTARPLRTPSR